MTVSAQTLAGLVDSFSQISLAEDSSRAKDSSGKDDATAGERRRVREGSRVVFGGPKRKAVAGPLVYLAPDEI